MSWLEFWGKPHSIYANRRNLEAHFECLARDLARHLPTHRTARILDWGCGDALAAPRLAGGVGTLFLYDGVEPVRERLRERYRTHANIQILDEAGLATVPDGSVDMIVVISVLQYLDRAQLRAALADWHRLLHPQGELLVADVIDPHTSPLQDMASQLRFAASEGFLMAALLGLARLAISDYARIRRRDGFSTYTRDDMLALLRSAGFQNADALDHNIGPAPHRHAFRAVKPAGLRPSRQDVQDAGMEDLPSLPVPPAATDADNRATR